MMVRPIWIRFAVVMVAITMSATGAFAQKKKTPRGAHEHREPRQALVIPSTANITGTWTTLDNGSPINPVHVALLHTGNLLVIQGSGNYPGNDVFAAAIFYPATGLMSTFPIYADMFCNGMAILPDGRPLVVGGTLTYDTSPTNFFTGSPMSALFDPAGGMFTRGPNMADGRWYPTATVLPDGTVMAISGLGIDGTMNGTVEIYDPATNRWNPAGDAFEDVQFFPRQHVLPNGKVFEAGWNPDTQMWDPATHVWTPVATTNFGKDRQYGTSVLLPLSPADGYKAKVIIMGGGPEAQPSHIPGTATTETIDFSVPRPAWQWGPKMSAARIEMNATLLPNGKVLISGGSAVDEDVKTSALGAEMYDPATNSFSPAGTMAYARLYHSNTILLPDATVLSLGGNPIRGDYEGHIENYKPPYLFGPGGVPLPRPVIAQSPRAIRYGATFTLTTLAAANIERVVMMRPGAVTHSFDMEQRLVELTFKASGDTLQITPPPNANLAPPGYYMIFILDKAGVPSIAKFVHMENATR